jgi:Platelet-activating factor acetylhydrolase, isoform II
MTGRFALIVAVLVCTWGALFAREPDLAVALPRPTGSFPVGRTSIVAYDATRGRRPVSVAVWYPAKAVGSRAEYFPGVSPLLRDAKAGQELKEVFGASLTTVSSSQVLSYSSQDASIASRGPFPLLLFLPGLGLPTFVYTSQFEDLASRGYVVAAISPIHDSGPVLIGGKPVPGDEELWAKHPPEFGSSQFYADRARDWAKDLIFALDALIATSGQHKSRLAKFIDTTRIGAFGHSQGGRASATACILDHRIRACLNEDGRYDDDNLLRPYWPIEGRRLSGAFAMLDWFDPGLTPDDLASMHTDLNAYAKSHLHPGPAALAAYSAVEGGSFRLTILQSGMSHTAFTDLPLLRPGSGQKRADELNRMATIRTVVADFFDFELKGGEDLKQHCGAVQAGMLVQCFSPEKGRR